MSRKMTDCGYIILVCVCVCVCLAVLPRWLIVNQSFIEKKNLANFNYWKKKKKMPN